MCAFAKKSELVFRGFESPPLRQFSSSPDRFLTAESAKPVRSGTDPGESPASFMVKAGSVEVDGCKTAGLHAAAGGGSDQRRFPLIEPFHGRIELTQRAQ